MYAWFSPYPTHQRARLLTGSNRFPGEIPIVRAFSEGISLGSHDPLQLLISKEAFEKLKERYRIPCQVLDAWRYRSWSGCGVRQVEYDDAQGNPLSISEFDGRPMDAPPNTLAHSLARLCTIASDLGQYG
jgi:hypothetical protein